LSEQRMSSRVGELARRVLAGGAITPGEALYLLQMEGLERYDLFHWANRIRCAFMGERVHLCGIASARTALCGEDCAFCAQSSRYCTGVEPQVSGVEALLEAAVRAGAAGVDSFGIVTSGGVVTDEEIERLRPVFEKLAESGQPGCCGCLGCLTEEQARRLYSMGVRRYNHNLETSREFFGRVVTTHSYEQRLATVRAAQAAGMQVCCGGILGMGEGLEDRVSLAFELRELGVDSVPVNFLHAVKGTPLGEQPALRPLEALASVAMLRFVLPDRQIKVAGGRTSVLRDMQSWMFYAGASSAMVGDYLTTRGRALSEDFAMLSDLEVRGPESGRA